MAKAFKKKKLPKYRFGDSVYEDTEPSVTSNPTLLNTGGTEFTSTGSSNFYNNKVYNSTDIVPQQQPTSNNRANMSMYGNIAQSAASGLTNRQNARYTDSQSDSTNASLEEAGGKALPWLGMATSLRNMGQSMLQRDEAGNIKGGGSKMANEWMTADHTHMLREAKKGNAAGVLRESSSMGKIGRSISQLAGKDEETTGNWGKFNKIAGVEKKKELVDPNKEYEEQMKRQDMMNKLSSGTFRQGGISYPTNAIPIHGGNWAIPTFPNGGTFQVNGPTHENGGVEIQSPNGNYEIEKEEAVQVTPEADRILSDNNKLKLISTGRNPAQSYKPYQSKLDKLNKLASKGKLDKYGLESLKLTDMASKKAFDNFYDEQESLKITKVNNYIKRLGGLAQYQDGGPKRNKPTGYEEAILVDPSKLPSDYKFKQRTTTQLGGGRTEVTNLYNKPVVDKAIPGGKPDDKWEKSIINRLQSGESPEDLRDKGFFGDEGVEKYAKFYRPLKTVTTQEAPKTDAKLYGEKTIAGKLMPRGYAEQPWDTYRTFPEAGKANVYTDVNYYQGKPIDLTKSFNSGKFVPSYLDSNATGTYLQQQGTEMHRNPLDTLPDTDVKNLKSYSINRYGGIQKYSGGGKKSLVFKPKPITEDAGVEYPSVPNSIYQEPYNSQDVIDPRFRTKPGLNDTEAELLVKSAQEQSKKYEVEQLAKEQGSPKYNWKDTAYQVGTGLASNMGEILALHKASKPVEVQKMYEYSPEKLDFTPTERSYRAKRRMVLENVKNLAGGSSGTALSNIAAQNAALTEQEDSARREFANINAGIGNQAKQFNIGNRYATDDINARNRAAKQNLQLKATERMGSNIAQQAKDYRMSEQDKEMLPFLQQAFSDPSFKAMLAQWAKTKGYSK